MTVRTGTRDCYDHINCLISKMNLKPKVYVYCTIGHNVGFLVFLFHVRVRLTRPIAKKCGRKQCGALVGSLVFLYAFMMPGLLWKRDCVVHCVLAPKVYLMTWSCSSSYIAQFTLRRLYRARVFEITIFSTIGVYNQKIGFKQIFGAYYSVLR